MRLSKLLVVVVGTAAVFGLPFRTPAFAQTSDETVSPCCAKLCNPVTGTSVACKPAVLGGLGTNDLLGNVGLVRGCVDVETAPPGSVCYGGAILDTGAPALLNGCLCLFGDSGSVGPGSGTCIRLELGSNLGEALTPEQCTALSIQQCGANTITTKNDPACSTCPTTNPCGNGVCDAAAGENCSTCAADCGCTGSDTCQNGVCTPPASTAGACSFPNHCFACDTTQPLPEACQAAGAQCVVGATCN